jgi:hypothetical protein
MNQTDDFYFLNTTGNIMYVATTDKSFNIIVQKSNKGFERMNFTDNDFKEPCSTYTIV